MTSNAMQQSGSPDSSHPLRLMLFDNPRTTCQAFYKLWQSHPQLACGRVFHSFAGYQQYGPERVSLKFQHSDIVTKALEENWVKPYTEDQEAQKDYPPTLELALQKFEREIHGSEADGKVFYGKEHIMFLMRQDVILSTLRREDRDTVFPPVSDNPTYIPVNLLKTLTPIITIRHPLLVVDSAWRAQVEITKALPEEEDFEFQATLKWARILYDYFKDQLAIEPVVLESEDFIYKTKAVTDKLCAMYGLDPEGVKDTWDPVPKQYWPKQKVTTAYLGHMLASKGIERDEKVTKSPAVASTVR